jgi:TRAP-type C4-dicarboxylate transport system permease small subunit
MDMLKRIGAIVLDVIEIYIPVASFIVMLFAFLLEIFYRYVLDNPLTWPFEVTTITFLWTVLFGAIYARRTNEHIVFSLLFDIMPLKVQEVFRFLGNSIIFTAFGIGLYPAYNYIQFMKTQTSPALGVPFNVIYFPYLIFSVCIMGYSLRDLICAFKQIISFRKNSQRLGMES